MRAQFLSDLETRRVSADERELCAPLVFYSAILNREIGVPPGFRYDGASVPQWMPITYVALREAAEKAGAVHDYLYSNPDICTRAQADAVFREALEADGVGWFRRSAAWLGVRVGGWASYQQKGQKDEHEDDRAADSRGGD